MITVCCFEERASTVLPSRSACHGFGKLATGIDHYHFYQADGLGILSRVGATVEQPPNFF